MIAKNVFITGASEGLGRAFALYLAQRGYQTTLVARNEARLQSLLAEINDLSGNKGSHEYLVADLSSQSGIDLCLQKIQQQHYDILINNAGYSRFGDFAQSPIEEQQKMMTVNCQTVMTLSHGFLQTAQPGDALINLSSITNYLPTPVQPTYVATKCFIASLSESLWYQQRSRGVYVQGLCPGVTRTQFIERASDLEGFKKKLLDVISQTPEQVVATSIHELEKRRKPIVIPGLGNRILAGLLKSLPRKPVVWVSGKLGDLAS